ncbi:hypothetical protein BJV74DRAFT_104207 [Russula compacta]|nr:hypothetical protein BJV74DRAFT_104207 [Russula compacta]
MMQLRHAQRRLLSRCTLRSYSVGAAPANGTSDADAIAASDAPVPPRLRRPLASSFGGINIKNVAVPTQSKSQRPRSGTNRPYSRPDDSGDKPRDTRRTSQSERYRGPRNAGASSISGWGDELVSLTFSSRLKQLHEQKNFTSQNTGPDAEPQQSRGQRFGFKPAQRPQTYGLQRGQREQGDTSQAPRRADRDREKFAATRQRNGAPATGENRPKPQAPPMTRPSATAFKTHSQSSTTPAPTTEAVAAAAVALKALKQTKTKAGPTSSKANATAAAQPTTTTTTTNSSSSSGSTDRNSTSARLTALSSTNLNALFRARDSLVAGTPFPAVPPSTTAAARVRSVLERSAGDYSRFLPRRVGLRKTDSRLRIPAMRTARLALATQRDVSLEQRRIALHIIGELARPNRQVRA